MPESWFERLHLRQVINARGTLTSLGGNRMFPDAVQAMQEAAACFVDLSELGNRAGEHIAKRLTVEAALITAGAAAGLTQAAAACMAGKDPFLGAQLPDSPNRNEIIIQCTHRNPFDRALRLAGAKLREIGNAIETQPFELEAAISDQTVGVAFFLQASMLEASLALEQTLEIAHRHQVPVIVDAAAELPPKSNLWTLAQRGADLVIFSGGKDLRGPPASGLMIGKKELIEAAALQAAPYEYAVARPMKTSKEAILGLLAALEAYLAEDEAERFEQWNAYCDQLEAGLGEIRGLVTKRFIPSQPKIQPAVIPRITVQVEPLAGFTLGRLNQLLQTGDPPILVIPTRDALVINPQTLTAEEVQIIISRFKANVGQLRR